MFTGYNPVAFKLTIWTVSAVMCAVAGALSVPQVGIINPSEMSRAASIEIATWAAAGGRATLIGPIVGACFVARTCRGILARSRWLWLRIARTCPRAMAGLLTLQADIGLGDCADAEVGTAKYSGQRRSPSVRWRACDRAFRSGVPVDPELSNDPNSEA